MKKVLVCTDLYPDEDIRRAGSQTHAVKDLVESAMSQGLTVTGVVRFRQILARKLFCFPRKTRLGGVEVLDIPIFGYRNFFIAGPSRWALKKMLIDVDFDVVISHMSMSYSRAVRVIGKDKLHYLVVHQGDFSVPTLRPAVNEADRIYARSHSIQKKLEDRFPSVRVDGRLFSGIDDRLICKDNESFRFFDDLVSGLKILFCGSLIPLKNVDKIIESVAELRKRGIAVTLTVIGDGPCRKDLVDLVKHLDLANYVSFTGWLTKDYVVSAMSSSHFYVMPSKPETFGLAYLEAMASGCVVVGHANEGIDGVVNDGFNGYLVDMATPRAISLKIESFLSLSTEDKKILLERSQETVRRYTASEAGRNYAELVGS